MKDISFNYHFNRNLRNTLVNIAGALNKTKNLSELFSYIQKYLGLIIDTTNFYIALYHKKDDMLSILYRQDEKDKFDIIPAKGSLTGHVIKTRKTFMITDIEHKKLIEKGEMKLIGALAKVWLGVPLTVENEIIGAVVVQSYDDRNLYGKREKKILEFVSGQIAVVIDRKIIEDKILNNKKKKAKAKE